jgi:hypothetical protein
MYELPDRKIVGGLSDEQEEIEKQGKPMLRHPAEFS